MKIKKLIINNFRAFKHAEIDFDDFNCIIGKNDTGKSTILAALEWFFNPNKELDENDFAAAGFDWYEDEPPGYYDVITGETFQGECFKKYINDDFYISVDIYFNEASIPNNSEESEFIFGKDYLSKNDDICIRKWMCHPYKDLYCPYVEKQVGYRVNKHYFEKVGKMFEKEYDWFRVDNTGKLVITNGSPIEKKHSLPYCVRNQIDHPTVDDTNDKIKHNAYLNNSHFNEKELIRKSIKMIRNTIINNKKFC